MRREGLSLARAAKEEKTTPNAVLKYAATAVRKDKRGRWAATTFDRLPRDMKILTHDGIEIVRVTDSRTASTIARHWNALDRYARSGSTTRLNQFRGQSIRVGKRTYPLITDTRTINRLIDAGEVSFEDLYHFGE